MLMALFGRAMEKYVRLKWEKRAFMDPPPMVSPQVANVIHLVMLNGTISSLHDLRR